MNFIKKIIYPTKTIGIVGGGQLGKMLSIAAKNMGYKTVVLDPYINCCAKGVADIFLEYSYIDKVGLEKLAKLTDVITYEFENIPYDTIKFLESKGGYIPQGYDILNISQDRLVEKENLLQAGFKVAPYRLVNNKADLKLAIKDLNYPVILKTRSGGYDGKGQVVINSNDDLLEAEKLLSVPCILEKKLNFEKEISIIGFKSLLGDYDILPFGINVHKNNILETTTVINNFDENFKKNIINSFKNFCDFYKVVGILTIELFLVNGEIIANEIAPRPHNSGHWSLDGANVSQFEQHIRCICGLNLLKSYLKNNTVMINLLGQHFDNLIKNIQEISKITHIYLYGKESNEFNRKIGHINILEDNEVILNEKIKKIFELIEG